MDPHGEMVKSSVTDLQQETYRTTRARALAPGTGRGFDLGFDTIVHVTSPLPRSSATTQVVYEATLQRRNPAETFASDASQRVESLDQRRARITVRAIRPRQPADIPAETPPTDDDRNANSLIQSDDERIRQLAGTIAAEATDPWQIAIALEKWVHEGIQKKNFIQGFATAAEVAQSLEGDCTEHAVLLAALCRARQIPARVCIGLVYSSADQGFAFHMWNEAWIADRWIPLDATLGRGGTGADHLKLQHSSLSPEQAEGAVLSVLQVMNQLQLQILDVQ
jgi:transglutaminase-like putative cysteine protease